MKIIRDVIKLKSFITSLYARLQQKIKTLSLLLNESNFLIISINILPIPAVVILGRFLEICVGHSKILVTIVLGKFVKLLTCSYLKNLIVSAILAPKPIATSSLATREYSISYLFYR